MPWAVSWLVHALGGELAHLFLIMFVELDIVFAHQMVAFHAAAFGRFAVAVAQPGEHRLADVDAAVVDKVHLLDVGPVGGQQLADGPPQQVVADMAEMEGLVGVGGRVFHHNRAGGGIGFGDAEVGVGSLVGDKADPIGVVDGEIKESLDDIEVRHLGDGLLDGGTQLVCHLLGRFARLFDIGEHHYSIVAHKLFFRCLKHHSVGRHLDAIKPFQCSGHSLLKILLYHYLRVFCF